MPLRWEDGEPMEEAPASARRHEITIDSDLAPEQPEQVSITVTPSNGGYAYMVSQTDGQFIFGEKDEPMSADMSKVSSVDKLYANFGASDADSVEAASRITSVSFYINYKLGGPHDSNRETGRA